MSKLEAPPDIRFNFALDGHWIGRRAGVQFNAGVDTVIARIRPDGSTWGGVVYSNFTRRSLVMHMAGEPRWGTPRLAWLVFAYPFDRLGCEKVYGFVPETNKEALDYDLRLGFTEETRLRDAIPGGDIVVLSLERANCRWLNLRTRYGVPYGSVQG